MGGTSRWGLGGLVAALLVLAAAGAAGAAPRAPSAPVTSELLPRLSPVSLATPALIITRSDVGDPFILRVGARFLLFSSQPNFYGAHIPLRVSDSLTDWNTPPIDALPVLPAWASDGFTWGPDVRRVGSHYVLWFSAPLLSSGPTLTKCIGDAVSPSPFGPYRAAPQPIVCQLDHLGSIDPRSFVDPQGRPWLLWKSDDNADVNGTTRSTIWVQRLSADGQALLGSPTALITADQPWEGRIVEAPDMVHAAGHDWLFYSGNWFNQPAYAIGVAECASAAGPCVKPLTMPWLSSNGQGAGPGEASIFSNGSSWWMLYAPNAIAYQASNPRPVALVHLSFDRFGPYALAPAPSPRTQRLVGSLPRVVEPTLLGLGPPANG